MLRCRRLQCRFVIAPGDTISESFRNETAFLVQMLLPLLAFRVEILPVVQQIGEQLPYKVTRFALPERSQSVGF
ncbi:hypothetical protein BE15_30875 [Sorangium cellulosum]|uniref:Uncharacterized protein n=1 Tax=Sorangium cellulosum TaxID=56 RepID=A0A150QL53_SORCE|nr:hypothetical protein BE15_30875 [Sorangium cellulosum]